jgi:transglutaminase-like putative cysteine protease
MRFSRLYRASFYLMLVLATTVLSIDATAINRFAMLFPPVVAVAAVTAFFTVDRDPRRGLTRDLANFLAIGSFGLAFLEFWSNPDELLLLALGHWLIYLQLVKMFLPKTIEDDWFLYLLGLVQVLIGVYLSQSDAVGQLLFAWGLLSLWTLGLFHLHRESERNLPPQGSQFLPRPGRDDPYPGLVNRSFVLNLMGVATMTLLLGGIIFLLMPRWSARGGARGQSGPNYLTGFSDEIRIGQLGQILENDRIVMTVESFDESGAKTKPEDDVLWRGVSLEIYEDGRWRSMTPEPADMAALNRLYQSGRLDPRPITVRHLIKLEPIDTMALFAERPFYSVATNRMLERQANRNVMGAVSEIQYNQRSGTINRHEDAPKATLADVLTKRTQGLDYEVITAVNKDLPQPGEMYPWVGILEELTAIPDEVVRQRLQAIARPIVAGIPEHERAARAKALEAFLLDPNRFTYSLVQDRVDPSIDPVLDFLENRRQGHCEYFASALVLLCRSVGIPARMVNGFKGGDWNELANVLYVRQKHAHSWAEVLVNDLDWLQSLPLAAPTITTRLLPAPRWLKLDPTPSAAREAIVANVGVGGRFRTLTDFIRFVWLFYVVSFDRERQHRVVYNPIRELAQRTKDRASEIWDAAWRSGLRILDFKSVGEFFSVRGFAVSVTILGFSAGLLWLARKLLRGLARWFGGSRARGMVRDIGDSYLKRLTLLLSRLGLNRTESETPREFASRARESLRAGGERTAGLTEVPSRVVERYYQYRFGGMEFTEEALRGLDSDLHALELALTKP